MSIQEKARMAPRLVQAFKGKDETQQNQKKESDINYIVAQAKKLGSLDPFKRNVNGYYADVSEVPDYQSAWNIVQEGTEMFMELGPDVRKRFHNDPAEMIDFISKEENREESEKLGLLVSKSIKTDEKDVDSSKSELKKGDGKTSSSN